jgi:hypothetical protein
MSEKINLEEILTTAFNGKYWDIPMEKCKIAILEFGKQLLELAAENADCIDVGVGAEYFYKVDKQSILNTIKQVE